MSTHTHTNMSMNISISDDVYDFLKQQKRKRNTSFSQVIRELKEKVDAQKGSYNCIIQLRGRYTDLNIDYSQMNDLRAEFEKKL